ncbi:MAG: tyrosine-type recombinase/integrase [Eubacterium sp.]|nr:tyrosine-type recombinase/integrase [Eubacterium sp.]MCM1217115.1 tyrosine-type recombinase/integrase [Lachnospiraceae bacterium]MCM1240363.1 tyrosine-type recombinase/integrase [Lachnospiraceae bacterium]MCM1303695.1 tyrosine-type recombinase/integrase [Butyrivibrio sp.]MCM1410708.1 tyrosine-type recombinase/integrase [Lachnospiraceae bacterium]
MNTTQPIRNHDKLRIFKDYYLTEKPHCRNYALCVLGLNTALRISDILQLKWGNVYDFSQKAYRSHIAVTEHKTGKTNRIAINHSIIEVLTYCASLYKTIPSAGDYLFQSRNGANRPLSRSQAFRIVKEAARHAGLEQNVSCHSLRKTFGYHAWQQGTHPAVLMDIYNHSSYQITKRYLGIEQDDKDSVFLNISL